MKLRYVWLVVGALAVVVVAAVSIVRLTGGSDYPCWSRDRDSNTELGPHTDDLEITEYGFSSYEESGREVSVAFIVSNTGKNAAKTYSVSGEFVSKAGEVLSRFGSDVGGIPAGGKEARSIKVGTSIDNPSETVAKVRLKVDYIDMGCRDDSKKLKNASVKAKSIPETHELSSGKTTADFDLEYDGPAKAEYRITAVFRNKSGAIVGGCDAGAFKGAGESVTSLDEGVECRVPFNAEIADTEYYLSVLEGWN